MLSWFLDYILTNWNQNPKPLSFRTLFCMCNAAKSFFVLYVERFYVHIYSFLATVKFKESATEANLLWRAKSEPQVRILILFQLKTYLPCYYLLLVFWVAMVEWLAFSLPALKRVFQKKNNCIYFRGYGFFCFISYCGRSWTL